MKWSNDTVKKASKLRFAAGSSGYKALQDFQIPLPGIRTLHRRMQSVRFEPGILTEVFDFLKLKADGFTDQGPHVSMLRTHKNVAYVIFHANVQMYQK